jgi:thiosulfate/3-mercaptopyruvate sulfurtransferase
MDAVSPLVSTDWLGANIGDPKLVILDVRISDDYVAGHIPNAVNVPFVVPFSAWITMKDDLLLELPDKADLFNAIGSAGIKSDSLVVVVGGAGDTFALAGITRVADTLLYAGVKNVAILDGGYDKWVKEGRSVSTEPVMPTLVAYTGEVNEAMFVSKEYVQDKIGKSIIADARDADVYFGVRLEETWTSRLGHIPSAKSLPAPWLWTFAEGVGTYKNIDELREMASGIIGKDASKEIIVYCGVGGYASTAWFVLQEVLGYTNVKVYDGSAQEWTRDPEAPVVRYRWE